MKTLLGQRIREQRRKKGWTMDKLAEKADLSVNYVGDLERGVKTPSLDTFIRIVEALDVPADVLIRDSAAPASYVADDELNRKLSRLTPGQKKAATDILNAYMVTIIKTEFMKLKRYFIVWIGVSLMLLTVLLTLFTTMADDGMVWDYQFLFEQVVKHFVTMIFPMCITLISGYMISREYTDDTLKNIETLPISFRKLLAGKLIVSAILSLFLGIVCFVFTVIANFIMGYDGFALIPALTGLVQMALLGFFLYLTMLPIIVLTSRYKGSFLVGVIVAFVYGFIGMFANGTLQSIYPVSAALGLINYRAGAEGVMWNKGLCFISILIMCAIGIALMFVKQKPEKREAKKTQHTAPKKGW